MVEAQEKKDKMHCIRLTETKAKALKIHLATEGKSLQEFLEGFIDQELPKKNEEGE